MTADHPTREERIISLVTESDALVPTDFDTLRPHAFVVLADNLPHLVRAVLDAAALVAANPAPAQPDAGLSDDERADLLRAWPWPREAATTAAGFADVVAAVNRILAARAAQPVPAHTVHVTAEPVAEDVVWCEECEEWVTSGEPEAQPVPAPEICGECGHLHAPEGCSGPPTPSDLWAGVSPSSCDCDFDFPAPVVSRGVAEAFERSSFGTPASAALRATVSDERAARVVARVREMDRDAVKAEALREAATAMSNGLPDYDPHRDGIAAFEPSHVAWLRDRANRIVRTAHPTDDGADCCRERTTAGGCGCGRSGEGESSS